MKPPGEGYSQQWWDSEEKEGEEGQIQQVIYPDGVDDIKHLFQAFSSTQCHYGWGVQKGLGLIQPFWMRTDIDMSNE